MPDHEIVFHADPYSMCSGGGAQALPGQARFFIEHGTVVICGVCQRTGVVPEPGHELEFCAPGTERTEDGGFIWKPPSP